MGDWDQLEDYLSTAANAATGGGGKLVWVSDGSGCADCAAKNGQVYDTNSAPKPPLHPNCRCSLQPA